jgi:uncharacterized protein (TIGR03435 family)
MVKARLLGAVGIVAILGGTAGVLSVRMRAQSDAKPPAFEVASIKPNLARNVGVTGGCRGIDSRLAANDPRALVPLGRCVIIAGRLSHVMAIAFGMPLNRIAGFPEWDGPNRFNIEAKAEDTATTTEQQLLSMLQHFLTDAFKLTVRRETKEVPTFSLVVAKNGPKNLRPSEEAGCRMPPPPQVAGLVLKGCSMQEFAEFLSTVPTVQRPVKDRTAINGRFDFSVDVGSKPSDVGDWKSAMTTWETIFSDVQEQLGLRFERSNGVIETLVIDHAEKPTPD